MRGWLEHIGKRFVVLGLLLGLIASLVIPDSRQLQVSLVRLLFHLRDSNTVIHGQRAGCILDTIPHVEFTPAFREKCEAKAASSPEAFLLARCCYCRCNRFPPSAAWRGHALLEWGALEIAGRVTEPDYDAATRPSPKEIDAAFGPSPDEIAAALDLVNLAQADHPANGALWMAEAVLDFERGQFDDALRSLEIAAQRPQWSAANMPAVQRAGPLLQQNGLPRFDAVNQSYERFAWPRLSPITSRTADHLARMITSAVRSGDDGKLRSLVVLWARLRQSESPMPPYLKWFPLLLDWEPELPQAAAQRLGRTLPDLNKGFEARMKAEHEAVRDYLSQHASAAPVRETLEDNPRSDQAEAACDNRVKEEYTIRWTQGLSSVGAALGLLLMAWIVGLVLVEIPFAISPSQEPETRIRRLWFWVLLAVVATGAGLLVFSAVDSFAQPVGLRSMNSPPEHRFRSKIVCSIALASLLVGLRLLHLRHRRDVPAILSILLAAYIAAVGAAAYWRYSVIEAIHALYGYA